VTFTLWCPKCKKLWEEKAFQNNQPIELWILWAKGVKCGCGASGAVVWVCDLESLRKLENINEGSK
jgi:hypothetical protein